MYYYHVLIGTKHIDLVKASSGEEAIKLIEIKFGSSKVYSSIHQYQAVRA
jgi:hypothetical protein